MATARAAWGIDIGNRALKAVKVVREPDAVRIVDFDVVEHENVLSNAGDNRETLIQNALLNFVQTHNVKGAPVAVGVSGQSSFARFIKLPPVEDKQIPSIVRFEAIQQIPFPLEDVEWSYHLFKDEASPDVEVGIFAMRKELVQQHIKFFTDAGLNVQAVQMNPLAVYNGLYHDQRLKGTTMVIDLGAENTDLIIAEGETVWLRSIPIGGNNFTEALVKSFKLRFEKAEELKRNAATSKYGRQILQAMRPIFADLVAEIQRSIGFYASVHRDSRITKVIALGGTFRLPGLQKYLQQNLQLDVQKIDRLGDAAPADAKVATALGENVLSSVSAYGLALQAVGDAKIESSLLPQAIRREREWKAKTKWFAAAAACFVVGSALPVARWYYEGLQYDKPEAARARKEIADQVAQVNAVVSEWRKVENAGTDEKKQIANIESMARYREMWENIYTDIVTSVPPTDPAQAKLPRAQRRQVLVDEIQPLYQEDLSSVLPMKDDEILAFLGQQDPSGRSGPGAGFSPGGGGGGLRSPAGPSGPGYPPPSGGFTPGRRMPSAPAPAPSSDTGNPAPAGPRGFIVRIHCMTPYDAGRERGLELVTQTLVQSLRNKPPHLSSLPAVAPIDPAAAAGATPDATAGATPAATPGATSAASPGAAAQAADYRIEKVWVPRYVKVSDDPARVMELRTRAHEAAARRQTNLGQGFQTPYPGGTGAAPLRPRTGLGTGGGPGYPPVNRFNGAAPAAPMGTRPGVPGMPGTAGGTGATDANGAPVDDLVDPQTGESILNDGDAFVVAAVVLDPDLSKPPAGATASPGPAPAGAPGTPGAAPAATPPAAPTPAPPPAPAPGRAPVRPVSDGPGRPTGRP